MSSSEAPQVRMELIKNGDDVVLDIQPPVNEDQHQLIRGILSGYGVAAEASLFRDIPEPRDTEPFTEINCTDAREEAGEAGCFFDEQYFAREVWDVLFQHGNVVELNAEVVSMERSHRLLGLN